MRKPIVGGNWKMNRGTPNETVEMLESLIPQVEGIDSVDIVIATPFTVLTSAYKVLKNTDIKLGAQNMYYKDKGAYTGEISPQFLKEIGVEFVILGHSERRDIFKESDALINKKLKKALSMNLKTIVCIGEHLEERETGKAKDIIQYQINETFKDLSKEEMIKTVIAYEPIWAIGTGKTATPEQAEEIHMFIRDLLSLKFDKETADSIRIQYGGSIKPDNAEDLFNKNNIDGGLVGGASLQANSFFQIIEAADKSIR
ncbi:MAG: triose-phosphate isomerase [Promethearchaeota archaeon Loki_b32]|nr:MAG: triose-phosphate isomerase [Candidatus Lokiarchaeota archaeon Loki_b32]